MATVKSADDLRRLPVEVHPAVLEHLLNPDHLGCGHVRLMLQNLREQLGETDLPRRFEPVGGVLM